MSEGGVDNNTAADVRKAFDLVSGGIREATQRKLTEYAIRARSESVETLGVPQSWQKEVRARAAAIARLQEQDRAMVWTAIQAEVPTASTSFDPKAFEYAWRILMGEDTNQVLQGLNNFAQNRVKTYIDAITRWAVEGAAGQQR
ncbi:hypothetical protein A3D08_01210 [Candidatus Roizmanbacteria bacterium RIFCSPHIGHO2_02_FULL_43_11]|uniref:Uncharacterized protein n=1 Tax=Candidatus Roizmanbacteria bacterium RIFCSPHIGHO2_02_FULL_43_11 TaxID=1802043 RepID=A0A1F7HFG8_9BACT|nr:MAG: hypothetical protein A3D08_01210 [Candidatus Roizmanbacteria bacterium RIFCSPHIGHO2_02_FULL_43_11]